MIATKLLTPAIIADCRKLAFTIAPDLRERPLYILPHCGCCPVGGCTVAFTPGHERLDVCTRDRLIAANEWEGPGTTIVFVEDALAEYKPIRTAVLTVLLHELAHNLPLVDSEALPADEAPTEFERIEYAAAIADWSQKPIFTKGKPGWWPDHDDKFIRRALHLHYRAKVAGEDLPLCDLLCAGWGHSLSNAAQYRDTMIGELEVMKNASFAEIEKLPLPFLFDELFTADYAAWKQGKIA